MRLSRAVLCGVHAALALLAPAACALPGETPVAQGGLPEPSAAPPPVPPHRLDAARDGRIPGPPGTVRRPSIVPREHWQRGQTRRQPPPQYADRVVAVFIHHTDTPNGYDCADVPHTLRNLYASQAGARHWDDIGYNFLVDACGTIYEGRAGGVDRPVVGAHAQGFNRRTAGIAAIGNFPAGTTVPKPMLDAIAVLVAWKLGLGGVDPRGKASLVSTNAMSRYRVGERVLLDAVAAHTDAYPTSCPGRALLARLPWIRQEAARLQGRLLSATPSPH